MKKNGGEKTSFDVFFGRGATLNRARQNSKYRQLISTHSKDYQSLKRNEKKKFAYEKVINPIKEKGGTFYSPVKGTNTDGDFVVEESAKTIEKTVMQALRDGGDDKYIPKSKDAIKESTTGIDTRQLDKENEKADGDVDSTIENSNKQNDDQEAAENNMAEMQNVIVDLSTRVQRLEHLLAITLSDRSVSI